MASRRTADPSRWGTVAWIIMAPEMLTRASWVLALAYPDDRVHGLGQFVGRSGTAAARSRTRTGRGRSARCDASPLSAGPYSADIAMQPSRPCGETLPPLPQPSGALPHPRTGGILAPCPTLSLI